MSTYTKITRHPLTGEFAMATWRDDYFGPHLYGVEFPADSVVYPSEQVSNSQLETLWFDDVTQGLRNYLLGDPQEVEEKILKILEKINEAYKDRWKRDPVLGEGAVK